LIFIAGEADKESYFCGMNIGVNARVLLGQHMEGVARYIYETTHCMALSHPEDQFFLFMDRRIDLGLAFPANVQIVVIPLQARHPILWRIWFDLYLPKYLRKYKIDVFYSGDGYCSLATNVPTVLVIHDIAYVHFPEHISGLARYDYRFFVPKYIAKAKHVITVSAFVKQDLIQQLGVKGDKISIAYNAIIKQDFKSEMTKLSLPTNFPFFVYVGSLNPRKNIVRMIQAFEQFNANAVVKHKFVIAGKLAWKSNQIRDKITNCPDVIYLGAISEEQKYFLLKNAKASVYCSLHEGFGIPILEAFSQGTPVITSNVSSMPEVAKDGAICVNPLRVDEIQAAMHRIANDHAFVDQIVATGLARVEDFSWSDTAQIIYHQLRKLVP
jgi:glycosyltransferase involved in cell wall biosynthesis